MVEKEEVTTNVVVLDILPGDSPRILTGEWLTRNGKPARLFQQMIPVPDAELFARFEVQVQKNNTVQITVTTEWREDGYSTYLSDFVCLPSISGTAKELVA